jgi:GTPase SAR1 family protein
MYVFYITKKLKKQLYHITRQLNIFGIMAAAKPTMPISKLIPVDNINICLLGCVSAGKSTILNTMFNQDFSQSKIKRTTMMPTVFVEANTPSTRQSQEEISSKITAKNAEIIASTENGQSLNLASHGNQLVFHVDKLDIKISKKFNVTIFDMPGLNDARTKEQYYSYLRTNFHIFNMIIFVVNIESGLNTSDEMEILELIASHIKTNKKSGKNIRMLTIANKADEMQLNQKTGFPEIVSDELKEMYAQIEKTIEQVFQKRKIMDNLIGIVPICGIDAHLFRMIKAKGSSYQLSQTQIQRIGISDMGNRFRAKSPNEQKAIVSKVLADDKFITDMITLSGFERVDIILASCIRLQSNSMVSQNIFQEMENTPKWDINNNSTLIPILKIYYKLSSVNKEQYNQVMKELVLEMNRKIISLIAPLTNIESIIRVYCDVIKFIDLNSQISNNWISSNVGIKDLLTPFWDFTKYPEYLIQKVVEITKVKFSGIITLDWFNYCFETIEDLGFLTKDTIEELLNIIIKNARRTSTFEFSDFKNKLHHRTLNLFEKIKIADNFMQFLSFFIRNQIQSSVPNFIIEKLFIYSQNNDTMLIPIREYLRLKIAKEINIDDYGYIFDDGYTNIDTMVHCFDLYYIKLASKMETTKSKSILSNLMTRLSAFQ